MTCLADILAGCMLDVDTAIRCFEGLKKLRKDAEHPAACLFLHCSDLKPPQPPHANDTHNNNHNNNDNK